MAEDVQKKRVQKQKPRSPAGPLSMIFFVFSLFSFMTGCYYAMPYEDQTISGTYPSKKIFGPITVTEPNSSYLITITGQPKEMSWVAVEGQVLDQNKKYLFAFGNELYWETGYDDEGRWSESQEQFDFDLTLPEKGVFYIALSQESGWVRKRNTRTARSPHIGLGVTIEAMPGSSLVHNLLGVLLFVLAIVLRHYHMKKVRDFEDKTLTWKAN